MLVNRKHKSQTFTSISTWFVLALIILFSAPSFAQDKPINNKGKIKQTRAKSQKKKEKASTKDIAGRRLRTKNTNSVAGRAVHSNPSPYANERRGKDRSAKPIGGHPIRIRSRSAESARNNVYPQRGQFVNGGSKRTETGQSNKSRYTRSGKLSTKRTSTSGGSVNPPRTRSRSAESSRSNAYPQKGPFVNRSSKQDQRPSSKSRTTRTGRLSTSARITNNYTRKPGSMSSSAERSGGANKSRFTRSGNLSSKARTSGNIRVSTPRSRSTSAESARGKRFQQTGPFVNSSSKTSERASSGTNRYARKGKLSAGPNPPGKKRTVTPRSASQPFVSKGKKNVYWGKFSKGERAFTTDISGNPLGKKNFRTPPNEIIKPKDPYAGRKRSSGDRAYSGTFRSGHVSSSRRTENPWKGDVSGQAIRKRSERKNEVAGRKIGPAKIGGGLSAKIQRTFDTHRGIKPVKGGGGSMSGKLQSNKPLSARAPGLGAAAMSKSQNRISGVKPIKGAGRSASGKFQSNKPLSARAPGIGAISMLKGQNRMTGLRPMKGVGGSVSGKIQSNKPLVGKMPGKGATSILKGMNRITGVKPIKGVGGSASGKFQSNKPLNRRAPGIGAVAVARGQNRTTGIRPQKGGGGSVSGKFQSNKPLVGRVPGIGATTILKSQNRMTGLRPQKGGGRSMSGAIWNNNNTPINVRPPGKGGSALARYQNNMKPKKPTKVFSPEGLNFYKDNGADRTRKGNLISVEKSWNNGNRALPSIDYGKTADRVAKFQGNARTKKPLKGGGSMSGKLWNNNEQPIQVRIPTGAQAAEVGTSGNIKLPFFKKAYVKNPNAVDEALKKQRHYANVRMIDGLQVAIKARQTGTKPNAVKGSMPGLAPSKATVKASEYARSMKMYWSYKHNPSSADAAQKTIAPTKYFERASTFAGKTRLTKNYRHNPMSNKEALKVISPGRAYARITDYQGNVKMGKYNDKRFLPDAKFAHNNRNNVKEDRTFMMDFKLLWTKIFKKNGTQPNAVKEKSIRPRYDRKERELWPGLYD